MPSSFLVYFVFDLATATDQSLVIWRAFLESFENFRAYFGCRGPHCISNHAITLLFLPIKIYVITSFQDKRIAVLQMAYRARKVFGTCEKQVPGLKKGVENEMFWWEIGLGFREPGDIPLPRIPRSTPRVLFVHSIVPSIPSDGRNRTPYRAMLWFWSLISIETTKQRQ